MKNKTVILNINEKEAFEIRELLISLIDSKYATVTQSKILVKMVKQLGK